MIPGILVDWRFANTEHIDLAVAYATGQHLAEQYQCPIWMAGDLSLVPLSLMSDRRLIVSIAYLERIKPKVDDRIGTLQYLAAEEAHVIGAVDIADVADHLGRTEHSLIEESELRGYPAAKYVLDSWRETRRWIDYSIEVLRRCAVERGLILS